MDIVLEERPSTMDAIDRVHLATYTMGDPALEREILILFRDSLRDHLLQLHGAVGNPELWTRLTHTIKGSARGVGAFALGSAAEAAEHARDHDTMRQRDHIAAVRAQADRVFEAIVAMTPVDA
ncbi:MAG: Hpt domain-containing protein [Pseudomonadota bacterium]